MENLVSVIIPVYNSEKYVGECIESFLHQTYHNIELILIDDGSSDHSLEILKQYQKKFPEKITVYTQKNLGVAYTRNKGVSCANGKYIMFADNDDYAERDYVEIMLKLIEEKQADMIVGSCRKVDAKHKVIYEQKLTKDLWSKFRMIAPWARIIRKDFIIEKNIKFGDFKLGEDSFFSVTAYNESDKIYVTQYIGYNWVQRETSVSNTIQKKGIASPLPFLEALLERNGELKNISEKHFQYFITKFIVWNLYYICNNVEEEQLMQSCRKYFSWLQEKCPQYQKNSLLSPFTPKGEETGIKILVWLLSKSNNTSREWILKKICWFKRMKKYNK